jgi:phosphoglycolate phosphatase-like HAD superfamily hydrolase
MNESQNTNNTQKRKIKCLITDFDETFFRTAISAPLRHSKPVDWEKVYSLIPQFEMYPGWQEVLAWLKENNIMFAVVSQSTRGVLSRTFKHFGIEPAYVGCFSLFHRKPHVKNLQKALDALGLEKDEVISVGNSINDYTQAQMTGVRFVGACWDSLHTEKLKEPGQTADTPLQLIDILKETIK